MKCLVLGGGGFIGINLCKALLMQGYEVCIFDRTKPEFHSELLSKIEWITGDFLIESDIECAMQDCDVIFHLISTTIPKTSNENPIYDVESNLVGTLKILRCANRCGVSKVIFASSGGTVYGIPEDSPIKESHPTNPTCSYGIIKLAIEKYLHLFYVEHGLDYCVLRISNPYGIGQRMQSEQGVVSVIVGRILTGKPVEIWGDGKVIRDYIHIEDVIQAFIKSITYTGKNKIFNIGSGEGTDLNKIISVIEDAFDRTINVSYLAARGLDVPVNILDNTLARKELGWSITREFSQGIHETVRSHVERYKKSIIFECINTRIH